MNETQRDQAIKQSYLEDAVVEIGKIIKECYRGDFSDEDALSLIESELDTVRRNCLILGLPLPQD